MTESECAALVPGDTIACGNDGLYSVVANDTAGKDVTVSVIFLADGSFTYEALADASKLAPISTGEGGGGSGGPIVVEGDQFDERITVPPVAAITIKSSQGSRGFVLGRWGDLEPQGGMTITGPLQTYNSVGGRIALHADSECLTFTPSTGGKTNVMHDSATDNLMLGNHGIEFDRTGFGESKVAIEIDPATGDLIARSYAGPNAGMSVNLTAGLWALTVRAKPVK
jgi:hypothetical protein